MNRREKILAGLIAFLAVTMLAYLGWTGAQSALGRRTATLMNLRKQLGEQESTLQKAGTATKKLAELQKRSLPTDQERANSAYQQWLLNLVDRVGFVDPSVRVVDRLTRGGFYSQARFEVDAEATLAQLTDFLIAFYASGDLHRIRQLSIKPNPSKDSRHLDVLIGVEAISLPGSQRTTVGDVASGRFSEEEVPQLRSTILQRSMFFPANEAPRLEPIADQRVVRGGPLRIQARASDPDSWDALQFALDGDPPAGLLIEQQGADAAELRWSPEETGEYSVSLIVRDNGDPQRVDTLSFRISVVDPPPDEETPGRRRVIGFDDATQTFLVGTVANGADREAWFSIRTKGQLLKLSLGESLDVGSIVGEISLINESSVEIKTPEGPLRLRIGQNLLQGETTEPPSRQADSRL